ncbi:GNAT family N-acetyltransferase [Actinacidiphila epipremni]|uniref:GNAT family N-acetyltransferase n=1 Tax=Actinacidiphila epipremni TaxID=2053013 RepID=A0ABX0ZS80_9ACTN|nr:GNAT family N-acetyltransferase [Actinacidiphila epipremni]NJP44473.1 GNAT family N-acetyltransferase [Actinacidiphila epipremni]
MTDLHIRPARPDEQPIVEDLLREASAWLASRGIDQWQYPPHSDRIALALARSEVFIASLGDQPVGTLQLDEYADPEFWTASDEPHTALYVHRMAVGRQYSGLGVGSLMLDWASRQAAASRKKWLRLDAWKDNQELHRYYERMGFSLVRVINLPHRGSGALFQRQVVAI